MAWRKTPEEKKQIRKNESASYLARKTALDATDIKSAYHGREGDMDDHKSAYSTDNAKMGFGLLFAALGVGGVFDEAIDLTKTTEEIEVPESESEASISISFEADNMGGALIFAFAGAALIASGIKGKNAIKDHIQKRVAEGPKALEENASAPKPPAVS